MADSIHSAASELSAIVPEVWSARTYEVLKNRLIFRGSINEDYTGDISDLGDTVNIHSIPEFAEANELAEGARNDADSVTVSNQQLVINKRVVKDFILTKKAMVQSIDKMDKLREHAAFSIMKKMDSTIISTISPSTSAPDHDIAFDSGTTLALADILEAKELLDTANVAIEGRQMRCGSAQFNDIFNITGYTSSDFVPAGSPLSSGMIGFPLAGFEMDWSNQLGNVAYLFHPSFLTLAVQEQMQTAVYDLGVDGKRATRVNCDLLYGLKQLDSSRVVKLS
tara:strand:- start:879 stop:1721 length:843 start_codon:yes stop_codon:yes gene_type:complete